MGLNALGLVDVDENYDFVYHDYHGWYHPHHQIVLECPLRMGLNALGLVDSPPLDCLTV